MSFKPTSYQQAIFDYIHNEVGNLVVEASAGCGKSSTIVESIKRISSDKKICMLAFNKAIVEELKTKISLPNLTIMTSHGMGFSILRDTLKGIKMEVDEYKYPAYFNKHFNVLIKDVQTEPMDTKGIQLFKDNINQLINLCRVNMATSLEDIAMIADKYSICLLGSEPEVVIKLIEWGAENTSVVDFGDMIFLPNYLDMHSPRYKYDFVLIDEAQDLSIAQKDIMLRVLRDKNSRFISVGDKHQTIATFAGSSEKVFDDLKNMPNTQALPLSTSFRCPKVVYDLIQEKNLSDNFNVLPTAKQGRISYDVPIKAIKEGGMVLCRNKAPLMKLYTKLIKEGKQAYIKGKDIGAGMLSLVKQTNQMLLNVKLDQEGVFTQLYTNLFDLRDNLMIRGGLDMTMVLSNRQFMGLYENIQCLEIISLGINTSFELQKRIQSIFDETNKNNAIQLMTCHSSKGLENNDVYILCPSMMPSPLAHKDFEKQGEKNLMFVAYTRTLDTLSFISEFDFPPPLPLDDITKVEKTLRFIESQIRGINTQGGSMEWLEKDNDISEWFSTLKPQKKSKKGKIIAC